MNNWYAVAWVVIAVVLIAMEALTFQMVAIWFALGALVALIPALMHAGIEVQVIVFLAVSAVTLVATRPLVNKVLKVRKTPTNADRVIGQTAVVTEQIDNLSGTGQVNVAGQIWSARSAHDVVIPRETEVRVLKISGVKVIVEAI